MFYCKVGSIHMDARKVSALRREKRDEVRGIGCCCDAFRFDRPWGEKSSWRNVALSRKHDACKIPISSPRLECVVANFEGPEMNSPYVQHETTDAKSFSASAPTSMLTRGALSISRRVVLRQTFYVARLTEVIFRFIITAPKPNALFNVKLSIKLLCCNSRESHKSSSIFYSSWPTSA